MNEFISLIKTTQFYCQLTLPITNTMFLHPLRVAGINNSRVDVSQINQWKNVRQQQQQRGTDEDHHTTILAYKSMSTLLIAVGINTYIRSEFPSRIPTRLLSMLRRGWP